MGEKKEKKEMSKGLRIFIIVLLSIIILYFLMLVIANLNETQQRISEGNTNFYIGIGIWLIIVFLCGYGIIKNIIKLIGKDKKFTAEQLQKRKKRNTIFGLSSVLAVVLVIVVMFGYGNINESNEKEQMISKIKEYQDNGYLEWSNNDYQELEQYSNSEIKKVLNRIETSIKIQQEYDEKYSAKLDEIFAKEIKVELYQNEDNNYVYIPFNTSTGERHAKAQVEYVTINKYGDNIVDIYYSVEMNLTVYNKYNGKVVSNGLTKKYYKIPYLRDTDQIQIDQIQKINNYNDQAILDEINRAIDGKTIVVVKPAQNKNYKYDYSSLEK